jgi:hypothetical protein
MTKGTGWLLHVGNKSREKVSIWSPDIALGSQGQAGEDFKEMSKNHKKQQPQASAWK